MTQQIRLCHHDDIQEKSSKGFEIDDISLFAVKAGGKLFIYKNQCPHLGIELNWLENQFLDSDNTLIQCSTHGALFLITNGECVAGPCTGEALISVPHTQNDSGEIFISL